MSFVAYIFWALSPYSELVFEFLFLSWVLSYLILLLGLKMIELWETVIWNENVGIWGQEKKWFALPLLWFEQQPLFSFRKYRVIDDLYVKLLSVHVSRCLICERDLFLKNVKQHAFVPSCPLYLVQMGTCLCRTFSGEPGIPVLPVCIGGVPNSVPPAELVAADSLFLLEA